MVTLDFYLNLGKGKIVPMLNKAPHHADIWGSGSIAPHILKLGSGQLHFLGSIPSVPIE
jgi:hypothetical protein